MIAHEFKTRQTVFSPCRKYRYTLWREFYPVRAIDPPLFPVEGNKAHNYLMVIGLNPSKADEVEDDPTIRRCINFAKDWGFGALCMTNLFAWRDTLPENMKLASDPVGLENDRWLLEIGRGAGKIVVAWGNHGAFMERGKSVARMLSDADLAMSCFRLTKERQPEHPLYQKREAPLFNYPGNPL